MSWAMVVRTAGSTVLRSVPFLNAYTEAMVAVQAETAGTNANESVLRSLNIWKTS